MMNQSVTQKVERMQLKLKWNLESTSTLKIVFDTCLLSWPYRYKRPTRSTGAPATYFHVCSSCSLCFQADEELYPHGQTEKNHCWAPEATDARSDQAEFCGRGGGKWSAATFSFCFARWCQAGTVLEIPPAPLPSWPPRRQFSYISWKLKKKPKKQRTSLKLRCEQTAPCLLRTSCRHYELFRFWPDNRARNKDASTKKQKDKIKCQQSLVLIKHPAPTDSALDGGAARGKLAVIEKWAKQNQANSGALMRVWLKEWMGFTAKTCFSNSP